MTNSSGAYVVARTLRDLGVTVIFGLVGIPVINIAEEAINLGIRFIAFRNEQACSYAATAYGYITGRPGVCLVVGGPGVLHAMAGIGNSSANAFPLLVLAGSSDTHMTTKGAFQELDAISLLHPHTKLAIRPHPLDAESIATSISNAYRTCWYGRPGPTFIDLPADLISGHCEIEAETTHLVPQVADPPKPSADSTIIFKVAALIRSAKAPLIVLGKGAAYARAEVSIRTLIENTQIPFLPTPMGKGVMPDSSPLNTSSARSVALKNADVILLLGARLNWILHFGAAPKFSPTTKIIQVDIHAEEIGQNAGDTSLGIVGDLSLVSEQLHHALKDWTYSPSQSPQSYPSLLRVSAQKNERNASTVALAATKPNAPMTFQRAFHIIKETLHHLSPPSDGNIVYVSEGANTMDIARSIFPLSHPRQKLDAGTYATMGVGLGYAIASYAAYNLPQSRFPSSSTDASTVATSEDGKTKKIVALEGDSALGFSAPEIETMARYKMPILIFVMNNSGVYHGDSNNASDWDKLQAETASNHEFGVGKGLRSTTLGYETRYEMLAEMVGGKGFFVRTEEELEKATREGYMEGEKVVVVNVMVEAGVGKEVKFGWQSSEDGAKKGREAKL